MHAARNNIKPIKGKTLVLCNVDEQMSQPCKTAKGLGKPMLYRGSKQKKKKKEKPK